MLWLFLVSHFIIILMTLEWLLKREGQSCPSLSKIQNLLLILRMANWPFLDFSSSPWAAGLNLSRRAVSSLALPSLGALRTWWREEMECFGFPFLTLETGIAAAEQELILWAVLGRLAVPCTAGTTHRPEAGGFRWVWEASATNLAQLLPSCLTAWRYLNAREGFSTNTFSLRRVFPTFFTKKKKKVLQEQIIAWRLTGYLSTLRKTKKTEQ